MDNLKDCPRSLIYTLFFHESMPVLCSSLISHRLVAYREFCAPLKLFMAICAVGNGCLSIHRYVTLRCWCGFLFLLNNAEPQVEFVGLTGPVRFKEGRRSNITLDLLKLKRENLTKVGEWNGQMGLNITDPVAFYEGSTPNITLIVMTNEVCVKPI